MKRSFLFAVLLLVNSLFVFAADDWYYNSESITVNVDVSSKADIIRESSSSSISYINVNLSHVPQETFNQELLEFDSVPIPEEKDGSLLYSWEEPGEIVSFGYSATIKTTNKIVPIRAKIPFPITGLPDEIKRYVEPQENIDSDDPDIVKLASLIAEGEDDLYVVVHKLADWTKNNIEYDLSTLTAEVSQKASWVLENRQGVCDELTSLFIAQLRALGIPAKFISGVAYTNSDLFPENWGSHGWAEVYFPGVGWVPYDVTYGEFGYVDPTHIKMKESVDSGSPSIQYRWLARDVEVRTQELDIKTDFLTSSGRVDPPISLEVSLLKDKVDFGSYNLVEVSLQNLQDYYVSSELYISRPKEIDIEGSFQKTFLLKPNEKKSVYWIVKVPSNLERNFIYTFPITVSTVRNFSDSVNMFSQRNEVSYSFSDVQEILDQRIEEEEKTYSNDVEVECSSDKPEFYFYESANLECVVKNSGNTLLESLEICFADSCEEVDLGISQEKTLVFKLEELEEGKQQFPITLSNSDVSKAVYLDVDVLDEPNVVISELDYPAEVRFSDAFAISFLLKKESSSDIHNLLLTLEQDNFKDVWSIKDLKDDRNMVINLQGTDLRSGKNNFNIHASYEDAHGRVYESSSEFSIDLVDVTVFQNIFLVANGMLQRLGRLSVEQLLMVSIGTLLVFIFVVFVVFRRK